MKPCRRALCWVRRDLRLRDHAALALATARAERVAVVFAFDSAILDALEDRDDRRVTFIRRSLEEMDAKLRRVGSRLVVVHGDPVEAIPRLARRLGAEAVFAARDYEPYAVARDAAVAERVRLETVKDSVVFEAAELPWRENETYRAYARAWRGRFAPERDAAYHHADKAALWPERELPDADWETGFAANEPAVRPGEDAARERLRAFTTRLGPYRQDRHVPALEATSGLSVHLRFGTVSVRECVRTALGYRGEGAEKWMGELIWRDFYADVLSRHPRVASEPYRPGPAPLEDEALWAAWAEGRTGYPLVDAAMRRLRHDGTMHNRLRMVTASFLANDLRLDPRRGEAHFARHLLDFDLASNNGGWQWCASTGQGVGPRPNHLSPVAQSERFDPDGVVIRRWVPELRGLYGPAVHAPWRAAPMELQAAGVALGETYPWPVVDHAEARRRLGEAFAAARGV